MTITEFCACKPSYLRLGQHFVDAYWNGKEDDRSRYLYKLDGMMAALGIMVVMDDWQWKDLPEMSKSYAKLLKESK